MAPNSPECSFIHASMAGSRSPAPLNRSNSVLIVAPLFRDLRLSNTLHEKATVLSCLEERKGYSLSNAVAFTGSERLVGLIENEAILTRRLILCPALPVLIFFAIE